MSAWKRAAARERLDNRERVDRLTSPAEVEAFFRECDALEGPEREPDWDEHLGVIAGSRVRSSAGT